ncbi:MAG: SUMF1/EgtB/PvdO family nonheme iron enzyme [Verrucomicrobia bacterium]|nr:SUMF1/EgtB/PvdO family nonheme iron enzyme [Verrucomicrobiota bacterium]
MNRPCLPAPAVPPGICPRPTRRAGLFWIGFFGLALLGGGRTWGQTPSAPSERGFDAAFQAARNHFVHEQYWDAAAALETARMLAPERWEGPALAAQILHHLQRPDEAQAALREARRLVPSDQAERLEKFAKDLGPMKPAPSRALASESGDRLPTELDRLILQVKQAEAEADPERRAQLFREFLQRSSALAQSSPDELAVWTLRAIAAMDLNDYSLGQEAAQQMERLGASASTEQRTREVYQLAVRREWVRALPTAFENTLGMRFVRVGGVEVLFSVWETRMKDYAVFAAERANLDSSWRNPTFRKIAVCPSDQHPVVNVSWDNAKQFCEWLTRKERADGKLTLQQIYRLPTDLEWSVAVGLTGETGALPADRTGRTPRLHPWGTQWPPVIGAGNFGDISARNQFSDWHTIPGYRDGFVTTAPVGSFAPSPDGLFDLAGNVSEWCEDWYDNQQRYRVIRGGSWYHSDRNSLLSAARSQDEADYRSSFIGFRLVLAQAP